MERDKLGREIRGKWDGTDSWEESHKLKMETYEEYKETDTEDFISFTDIDDEWFVEQFFDRYKDYFRVDEDDNLYCRDVNGW